MQSEHVMKLKEQLYNKLKTLNRSEQTFKSYYHWLVEYCKFTDMKHQSVKTTMIYTHVLETEKRSVQSPLCSLEAASQTKIYRIV